ncbi:hypothetical protein ID866_3029 [Astraeus odoratus]|nr:hypothetical protein ID866_3029 [Astraeus odoratus]
MLVRVNHTELEGIARHFDEEQHRFTRKLHHEEWAEFMVVWRGQRVEIYEDYAIPGRELFSGHKKLAFLIPLKSSRTYFSLYSSVDLSFCILCPPTAVRNGHSKTRALFHRLIEGTNVFIFKVKSRARAQEWIWRLWLHLGGKIPQFIEISCPTINTRLKLDLPTEDVVNPERAYELFSVRSIVDVVRRSMISAHGISSVASRDWKCVIEPQLEAGRRLALDWRLAAQLDWISQTEDFQGNARPWSVLYGLSLKQSTRTSHLEIRVADHVPCVIHLPDGTTMEEPPGVEGYLDRIKLQSQTRQRVYLTSHDGNLFALSPRDANPPAPPSTHLSRIVGEQTDVRGYGQDLFRSEVERGATQIWSAYGVLDLRSIQCVRAVEGQEGQEGDLPVDEDDGGIEGLAKVQDKLRLRLRRSFEIVLLTGPVIRLEAHSCRNCLEWIDKLRALVTYWTHRDLEDTKLVMDVSHALNQHYRVTPLFPKCQHGEGCSSPPEAPTDPGATLPSLSSIYHWCILSDCKSIVKCGRVFTRKGLRGQYKLSQLILVAGRLIQFHVRPVSALHPRRSRDISLLDAYVCSGYLAALALPREEFDPNSRSPPRRYHDGLEVDEPGEDVLFMVRYRKSHISTPERQGDLLMDVPRLSTKFKTAVFRTRNKVERDSWCWALSCEIDKIVKKNGIREQKLRETGGLIDISH